MCVATQDLKSIRLYLLEIRYEVKEEAVRKAVLQNACQDLTGETSRG